MLRIVYNNNELVLLRVNPSVAKNVAGYAEGQGNSSTEALKYFFLGERGDSKEHAQWVCQLRKVGKQEARESG